MLATRIAMLGAAGILFTLGAITHAQKGPLTPAPQSLAAKIPANIKQAILDSLEASNAPTPDDTQGGFHEEGGFWVTTTDGSVAPEPFIPGAYAKPGQRARMLLKPAHPLPSTSIAAIGGGWHIHPCGEIINRRTLPPRQDGNKTIITVITTTTFFQQPPSDEDLSAALLPINLVVGARSKLVYFYDRSGVIGAMPLDEFLAPAQLPSAASCSSAEASRPAHAN